MIESLTVIEKLKMGHHGLYVWSAYFIYGAILVGWSISLKNAFRLKIQSLKKRRQRITAYENLALQAGSKTETEQD